MLLFSSLIANIYPWKKKLTTLDQFQVLLPYICLIPVTGAIQKNILFQVDPVDDNEWTVLTKDDVNQVIQISHHKITESYFSLFYCLTIYR